MNHPPSTGPTDAVMEVKPDHVPIARPRSSSEKLALISARLPGISNAPPNPLNASGGNQRSNVGRATAPDGGGSEDRNAYNENLAPAV